MQRDGFVHQITAELARNYALIGIEDLNVKGMTRSARGTVDAPGTNVRAKSSLNRRMLEGIPGEFRRQLEYKTKRTGAALEVIDRFYPSSKTCSRCGWKNENLSLSNRQFTCLECGLSLDRDHNPSDSRDTTSPQVVDGPFAQWGIPTPPGEKDMKSTKPQMKSSTRKG
ncbi:hypothetical protein CU042_03150 [Corynebacterium striatum]|nr:hypothetical protein [Corynebacterium striatum]